MKKFLALLLLLSQATLARDLTLKMTVEQAKAHSFDLGKSAALFDAASSSVGAARSERWPTLALTAGAQFVDNVPIVQIGPTSRALGATQIYQTDLRLTLPIFTGGRIGSGLALAQASRDIQSALAKGDSDRIAFTAWSEYLVLVRSQQLLDVANASFRRAEIISADVASLISAGVADSVDLNDSRLAHARARLAVQSAENQRGSAAIRTAILVGVSPEESITAATPLPEPGDSTSFNAHTVAPGKSELLVSAAAERLARAKVRLTVADFLPTLATYGGYSYGKPNGDLFNNQWRDYWTAGASLTWSFNLGGRSQSKIKSSRYELTSAQAERDRVFEQLEREARLAREQVRLALDRFTSAKLELQIATDQFRQAQERHRNGDLSSNRLLDIETGLTAAQSSLAASLTDYWLAVAYWYFTTGSEKLQEGM